MLGVAVARGGMATIHIARLMGAEGFSRIVAAKRLHPDLVDDQDFVAMFLDEARIASKVHHPNVVPVLDVVTAGNEIVLVQEYIHGIPLGALLKEARKRRELMPVPVAVAIVAGVLAGLHAAHEARDELGHALEIVHRDVSPQNVMIAVDGTARLLDFGVAKATLSAHVTREGTFKGKIAYMSPEQLHGTVTRASDIYSTGVLLWEALIGKRMHEGQVDAVVMTNVVTGVLPKLEDAIVGETAALTEERIGQLQRLQPVVSKALSLDAADRFATAAQMATALVEVVTPCLAADVAAWVRDVGGAFLAERERLLAADEGNWRRMQGDASGSSDPPSSSFEVSSPLSVRSGVRTGPRPPPIAPPPSVGPPPPPDERRKGMLYRVALGIILLVGVLGGVAALAWRSPSGALGRPAGSAVASPQSPSSPPSGSAAAPVGPGFDGLTPASPPASAPPLTVSPAATAVAPVQPARHAFVPPPQAYPVTRPATGPAATQGEPGPAPADTCNPPFYFDGNKKLYKPGCI